jgi:hypothetical protein
VVEYKWVDVFDSEQGEMIVQFHAKYKRFQLDIFKQKARDPLPP